MINEFHWAIDDHFKDRAGDRLDVDWERGDGLEQHVDIHFVERLLERKGRV